MVRSAPIALALLVLVACGAPNAPSPSVPPLGSLVSCRGGLPFPPAALTDGPDPMTMSAEPYGAFGAFLRARPEGAAWLPDEGWHLLAWSNGRLTFGRLVDQSTGEPPVVTVDMTQTGQTSQVTDWGRCHPSTVLPDGLAGMWWLAEPADPGDFLLKTLLSELTCASGASPEGRIAPPVIDYGETTVTIAVGIRPRPGSQECQGIRPIPFDIALTEPLGDRTLLDGGHWPPLDPTRPRD